MGFFRANKNESFWINVVFDPFTLKISSIILLTVCHTICRMLVLRFGIESTNSPLTDIFLDSHHFFVWYCIDLVRRNLSWSLMGVKGLKTSVSWLEADKWCVASYKATSKELNSGQLRPNPVRSIVKGLNSGPLDYKLILFIMIFLSFWCGTNCTIFHN